MAQHRRIPKKNRKKLKSVDPFNNKANAARFQNSKRNCNQTPVNLKDEQPLTKTIKNVMSAKNSIVNKEDLKKKKKQKNAVLKQAEELGMKKGKFETVHRFIRRIEGTLHSRINEQIAIAKHGLAGRKQEDIDADYKLIEDTERKKKDQQKREVENKIKQARKKREQEAKRKEEAEKAKNKRKMEEKKLKEQEEKMDDEDEDDNDSCNDDDSKRKNTQNRNDGSSNEHEKKLSKKERRKIVLKTRKSEEQGRRLEDALLNSREVVEFGERNDAPPLFRGDLKRKFEPLMAKAGQKSLLLHSMFQKSEKKTEYLNSSTQNQEERQRVIDAYRNIKKQRHAAAGGEFGWSSSA